MMTHSEGIREWTVIGAGPHGVHLTACLAERGLASSELLLLDRYSEPLELWNRRTSRLEMGFLRSSAVHHLGPCPWSLVEFAQRRFGHPRNWSAPPYQRPAYEVFQEHCEFVMAKFGIREVFLQRDVVRIRRDRRGVFELTTTDGTLRSRRVVLALGQAPPRIPFWAEDHPRVQHLLSRNWREVDGRVAVVGGGMTACQFSLANHHRFDKTILVAPSVPTVSDFDADPCWIGPKCRTPDFENSSVGEKRRVITAARRPGSVDQSVFRALKRALDGSQIEFGTGRVVGLEGKDIFLDSGQRFEVDQVVLGTGFQAVRPGGEFIDNLIESLVLPTTPCGYPDLSSALEWVEGLYVTGGLAELRLGPVARNITGARSAAKIIIDHAFETHLAKEKEAVLV